MKKNILNYSNTCSLRRINIFANHKTTVNSIGMQANGLKQYLVGCCMLLSSLLFATNVSAQPFAYILTQGNNIAVIDTEINDYNTDIIELPEGVTDPWSVAVHPDGTKIYVSTLLYPGAPTRPNDNNILVINPTTTFVEGIIQNDKTVTELTLSPDGKHLYGLTYDNNLGKSRQLLAIDTDTNEIDRVELACFEFGCLDWYNATDLAVSPDGQWVYVLDSGSTPELTVIDAKSLDVIKRIPLFLSTALSLAVSPLDGKVYVPGANGSIAVIDPEDFDAQATYIPESVAHAGPLVVSNDGSLLYVVQPFLDDEVLVVDTNSGRLEDVIPVGLNAGAISITPDGQQIYVMNYSSVSIIDTSTNQVTKTIPITSPGLPIMNTKVKFIMNSQS